MDDLKTYQKSFNTQRNLLSDIKEKMKDAGLLWNSAKCKVINIKRGVIDESQKIMELNDGTKLECLDSEQRYINSLEYLKMFYMIQMILWRR